MSYIDLLFPVEQLEALGNKWPEPASKRRKLESNTPSIGQAQQKPRRQLAGDQRRHTVSAPVRQPTKSPISYTSTHPVKRSNSESRPNVPAAVVPTSTKLETSSKSCLPSFIEPSLLKNYLHHLHPNDRSRYSIPNSPEPEDHTERFEQARRRDREDSACSPASLITDTSSSVDTADRCPTPSAGMYDQLRSRPFGYLIDGLRLTEHERDLMDNLLSPTQVHAPVPESAKASNGMKRKAGLTKTTPDADNLYDIDTSLLQRMFPANDKMIEEYGYFDCGYKDNDVHSSGLSPAMEEQDQEPEPVKLSTRGFAITVDDFFDLDEASGLTDLDSY